MIPHWTKNINKIERGVRPIDFNNLGQSNQHARNQNARCPFYLIKNECKYQAE